MAAYGSIETNTGGRNQKPVGGEGSASRRPMLALAALALICVAGTWVAGRQTAVELVTMGSLGQDERDMDGVESDIQSELNKNGLLTQKFHAEFGGGADMPKDGDHQVGCKCDCSTQPQLAAKARELMLAQVGENVFYGKCASCPCLQGTSVEAEVARLSKALDKLTGSEEDLDKKEKDRVPVDIVFRLGQKGVPGKKGPTGFNGPDGDAGAIGRKGPTGPVGEPGEKGVTGPMGFTGNEGPPGPPGFQGPRGVIGEAGPRGPEGEQGAAGGKGPAGINGVPGSVGQPGPVGDRGEPAPPRGPPGPKGEPGEKGVRGPKGPQGERGPKGYVGLPGDGGPDGLPGAKGARGITGKSCDGSFPPSGESPKVIDACGVCGGDESECANTQSMRTAYAVGDPHYRTFDGVSFDYQINGQYILARHMNDIEVQNLQIPCPTVYPKCNIGIAVITKNHNIQFKSELLWNKILVNGETWTPGVDFQNCQWERLDPNTKLQVCGRQFLVAYNDMKVGNGAMVYGYWNQWSAPLPNGHYIDIYMDAPARWSSGLSMTGLWANFDNNAGNDWAAIEPSTMWWVAGTPSSAFENPTYLLTWDNRITKKQNAKKGAVVSLATLEKDSAKPGGPDKINWSLKDERKYLVEVDELTTKMRKRLFAKMVADGAIERKPGQAKPTTGLAAVELDIMPYDGMRPDHLRIEQQILLRQEWKHLSKVQRKAMLAGETVSTNAVGMKEMCHECVKGEATCTEKGIQYADKKQWDMCHDVCLKWLKPEDTSAVCKCWVDCSHGIANQILSDSATSNYLSPRTLELVPPEGSAADRCIALNSAAVKTFKAVKFRQALWKPDQGT